MEIREARDYVEETLLVGKALLQDALDNFRAADMRPENDGAVMRGVEVTFPQWRRRPRLAAQEGIDSRRLDASLARPKRELTEFWLSHDAMIVRQPAVSLTAAFFKHRTHLRGMKME